MAKFVSQYTNCIVTSKGWLLVLFVSQYTMVYCGMGSLANWGVSRDTAARRATLCSRHDTGAPAIQH